MGWLNLGQILRELIGIEKSVWLSETELKKLGYMGIEKVVALNSR